MKGSAAEFDSARLERIKKALPEWLNTPTGQEDAAYLAEHYARLSDEDRYFLPMDLGRTGSLEIVPVLNKALTFLEDGANAMKGIFYACHMAEAKRNFREAVAPAVAQWLELAAPFGNSDAGTDMQIVMAIELLPFLDPELAKKALVVDKYLAPGAPYALNVLRGFNNAGITLPLQRIEPLLELWKGVMNEPDPNYVQGSSYCEAVTSLAAHDPKLAIAIATEAVKTMPGEPFDWSLVILAAAGLSDLVSSHVDCAENLEEFSQLPEEGKIYFALSHFERDLEIDSINGVLRHSDETFLAYVRKGYEIIGDKTSIEWLNWMCQPFGPAGPAKDLKERRRQMDAMTPPYSEQWKDLADSWLEHAELADGPSTKWLISQYATDHAEVLRSLLKKSAG